MFNKRLKQGFTLIEMAMVLVIMGLILYGSVKLSAAGINIARLKTTQNKLAKIQEALQLYYETNSKLPYPALGTLASTAGCFGKDANNAGCTTVGLLTFAVAAPTGAGFIGVVPVRTLNLPDDYMYDGWGNRISYAVATNCLSAWGSTGPNYCNSSSQLLSMLDSASANPLILDSLGATLPTVAYVVVSHGINGVGSWNRVGTRVTCTTASTYEGDNASYNPANCAASVDASFRDGVINDGNVTANYFDDIVKWQTDNAMYYIKDCKASPANC